MAFRKYATFDTTPTTGLRLVPKDAIEAHLRRLLDRYRTPYQPEDLEDYLAVLDALAPISAEEFQQVCRQWLSESGNTRAPLPWELRDRLAVQRRQTQPQTLESWQQPAPERISHEELQAILAGLKPSLR